MIPYKDIKGHVKIKKTYLIRPTLVFTNDHAGAPRYIEWELIGPLPKLDTYRRLLFTKEVLSSEREQNRLLVLFRVEYHISGFVNVLKMKSVVFLLNYMDK